MRAPDREADWLSQRGLSTDPERLRRVDQQRFLDGLEVWAERFLGHSLSNDRVAELAVVDRGMVEAWRAAASDPARHAMPLASRMLLVFRLLELLPTMPRWTIDDEQLLRQHWSHKTQGEIAALLHRTPDAIALKARQMGMPFTAAAREYSADDDQLIVVEYARLGATEIGRTLGRSPQAIRNRASKLGVSGRMGRPPRCERN